MGEFSVSHILILFLIYVIFFGHEKLPTVGKSLGQAIKGFKDGLNSNVSEKLDENTDSSRSSLNLTENSQTIVDKKNTSHINSFPS